MSEAVPPPSNAPPAPPVTTTSQQAAVAPTPQLVLSTANAATGTIVQLPPGLSALIVGQQIDGIVTARPNPGQILLETRSGALTVQTNLAPALGARLIVQVAVGGPQPSILIAPQPEATATAPLRPSSPAAPSRAAGPDAPLRTAVSVNANAAATAPSQPAAAGASDSNSLIRGSVVNAIVIRTTAPGGTTLIPPQANITAASGPTAPATGPAATAGRPSATVTGPTALLPGDRLTVRIAAIARPGTTAPPASPGTTSLTGTVTSTSTSGQAIVQTNVAELSLAVPRPLPTGSNLLLEGLFRQLPSAEPSAEPRALTLANRWETLHDALRSGTVAGAQNTISQAIPQPGAPMTNAMLFFLAALRAGDLRGWLGPDAMRLLERDGLLGRMAEEFGVMQRFANEPAGQDWRLFLIPVLSDEQLRQIRLFIRDNGGGAQDADEPKETRFIIEVAFSKLGQFQFDGLARPKALDLIIRTEKELEQEMKQSITEIFADTTSALGLEGSVGFRTEAFFELQPLRDSGLASDAGVLA
ncbi:MAG: hypothetical protein GKS00_09810 [Alphaproteobacteria bacterium]|nr:hypothetical protein [Alphaproteobacteria bacterium]